MKRTVVSEGAPEGRRGRREILRMAGLGAVAGAVNVAGLGLLYDGLARHAAAVVAPVAAVMGSAVPGTIVRSASAAAVPPATVPAPPWSAPSFASKRRANHAS